jgi:hypothetical protein
MIDGVVDCYAQYWVDPKAHPEVFDALVSLTATEQCHTLEGVAAQQLSLCRGLDCFSHAGESEARCAFRAPAGCLPSDSSRRPLIP